MDPTVLPSQAFTTAAALLGSVDKKVVVSLRDGRKLFGILRSFDQYANLVLQDAYEYLYIPQFGDLETAVYGKQNRGVYIIRGENVQLMGEIDLDLDDDIEQEGLKTNNALVVGGVTYQYADYKKAESLWNDFNNLEKEKRMKVKKGLRDIRLSADY